MDGSHSRRSPLRWILAIVVVLICAYALRDWLLPPVAGFLIRTDPIEKAEAIVVLAGDLGGGRILHAAELARDGLAPKVLVSGPDGLFGGYESDFAIDYAVKKGFAPSLFQRVPSHARSTRDEARLFIPLLRQMGIKHYILLSSDFHTRRAGNLFRAEGQDLRVTVVAVHDPNFHVDAWWKDRESQKTVWFELQKTLTEPFGL